MISYICRQHPQVLFPCHFVHDTSASLAQQAVVIAEGDCNSRVGQQRMDAGFRTPPSRHFLPTAFNPAGWGRSQRPADAETYIQTMDGLAAIPSHHCCLHCRTVVSDGVTLTGDTVERALSTLEGHPSMHAVSDMYKHSKQHFAIDDSELVNIR